MTASRLSNKLKILLISKLHIFYISQADQICYSVLCVFSYVAAGSDKRKPILMQHQKKSRTEAVQVQVQDPSSTDSKTTKTQQIPTTKPSEIPNPDQSTKKLVDIGKSASVENRPKPPIPARQPSVCSSPPPTEPPKMKPPQLAETVKRTQSLSGTARGPPPPIPARSGSIQYSSPPQSRNVIKRQNTLNSAMPVCKPETPPEFFIPTRRGSMTRQQSTPNK